MTGQRDRSAIKIVWTIIQSRMPVKIMSALKAMKPFRFLAGIILDAEFTVAIWNRQNAGILLDEFGKRRQAIMLYPLPGAAQLSDFQTSLSDAAQSIGCIGSFRELSHHMGERSTAKRSDVRMKRVRDVPLINQPRQFAAQHLCSVEVTMYLSKVQEMVPSAAIPSDVHRALWSFFPGDTESRDFLSDRSGGSCLDGNADAVHPPAGTTGRYGQIVACKEFTLVLQAGQRLSFLIVANPVKTIDDEGARLRLSGSTEEMPRSAGKRSGTAANGH